MTGHASAEELELVRRLESTVDPVAGPVDDLLELAQLYIEPCHREADAIRLLEAALRRDPDDARARFWLAYCCLHYLMDPDALRRAAALLGPVIEKDPQRAGAALMLLAEILEEQGALPLDRRIALLEASVRSEPEWVHNRQSLAWAYKEAGRLSDALAQIRAALTNIASPDPAWTVTRRNFEESITGRTGHGIRERLMSDVKEIEDTMNRRSVG